VSGVSTDQPASVLVLRFGSLGDVILTSPAVEALRRAWPGTRILYAIKSAYADLVRFNPNVDEVVPLEKGESVVGFSRRLRERNFEALLDLHGKMRSKLLRLLLPRTRRVIWHKRDFWDTVLVYPNLRRYRPDILFSDRHHAAVEQLVGRSLPRGQLRHFLGPEDVKRSDAILASAGVDPAKPILGMSPGANWETKRWPVERFGELATRAIDEGFQVVVVGSESERDLGAQVVAVEPRVVDLTGALPIGPLGGFVSRCAAFAANDSGPMHMARALGVPTLAFFGSTDPSQFDFSGHGLVFGHAPCAPCSFYGRPLCPLGHFACMMDVGVDNAWKSLEPLLHGGRRPYLQA
jgi:ADP-heptose:LPS heptosyltransferase